MKTLLPLLANDVCGGVWAGAANLLTSLFLSGTAVADWRDLAVNQGVISLCLARLATDKRTGTAQKRTVQSAAMEALMALTINVEAKKTLVREAGANILQIVLSKCVKDVLDAATKKNASAAERPEEHISDPEEQAAEDLLLFTMQVRLCEMDGLCSQ
jgi:hypothetical protein